MVRKGSGLPVGEPSTPRVSVKDRLGPRKAQPTLTRRQLFTTPNETHSGTHAWEEPGREHRRQEARESIRQHKIQQAKDALVALRLQQVEWDAQLAELEEEGELSITRGGEGETTPRGRHSRCSPSRSRPRRSASREQETAPRGRHSRGSPSRSRPRRSASRERGDSYQRSEQDRRVGSPQYAREEVPAKDIPDPIMQKFAELEQRIAATQTAPLPTDPKSPFTPEIDGVRADPARKLPPLETYDGSGDPYDHTQTYDRLMRYYGHSDAARCQMFITTLTKGARQWMNSLSPNSIGSWLQLCDRFHDRFGSNKRRGKLTASLIQVKQRPDESLSRYVTRFREAVGTVTDLNMPQALGFFTTGLDVDRSRKLLKDIVLNPPSDLSVAYDRAESFIAIDEAMGSLKPQSRWNDRSTG